MNLKDRLFELKDEKYKAFSSSLTKTRYPMIGVRVPLLKMIAKEIKDENLSFNNAVYFEEIMIEGLQIGYLKDIDLVIERLKNFVCKVDDWSVCDSVCSNLKITINNKEKMWKFITSFLTSNKELEIRFMLVMMINYYLENKYIHKVFDILDNIKCDFYYVDMAMSWLLATS